MAAPRDVIIIGAGLNGLVCAHRLAQAGLKPLVLERRDIVGGQCVTEEFAPGFRCSPIYDSGGPLLGTLPMLALAPDGRTLRLQGTDKDPEQIARFSKRDAKKYPEFTQVITQTSKILAQLFELPPPDMDDPSAGEMWGLAKIGRRFRKLGEKEMFRLLRWGPMAAADLVGEMFETELLRAALAARGCYGTNFGPWSAGSAAVMLLHAAAGGAPLGFGVPYLPDYKRIIGYKPGEGWANFAREAGAQVRTGAEVERVLVKDGAATGVVLASGEEIAADTIVSGADPKRTLLGMTDPVHLDPSFVVKMRNYRCTGTVARVHLALDGLPAFRGVEAASTEPAGGEGLHPLAARLHIGHEIDYLERAFDHSKYGEFSQKPWLEACIPSLLNPLLAPGGKHVMSVHVQYAPYKLRTGDWDSQRDALGDAVVRTLAEYAPDLPGKILHRHVITPLDLERTYGLTGGHLFHGELALDQLFITRPILGWARYRTPIRGLWLCGAGTHPGVGFHGESGRNAAAEVLRSLKKERR